MFLFNKLSISASVAKYITEKDSGIQKLRGFQKVCACTLTLTCCGTAVQKCCEKIAG